VGQKVRSLIIEQNKWLQVMQEEQPIYDGYGEHESSEFYDQNASWIEGEVDSYLRKPRPEKQ